MARNALWHSMTDDGEASADTVSIAQSRDALKQVFGRRLWRLIRDRGWTQSELARRADLGRDVISTYTRGVSLPEPKSAQKLANALGIPLAQLMAGVTNNAPAPLTAGPPVSVQQLNDDPNRAWLRINMEVPFSIATQILALLPQAQPSDQSTNSDS